MVYRVYGGNAKLGGSFASNSKTADKIQAKLKNALLPEWKNTRNFEAEILVPKGTKLNIGVVAPQTIKSTGTVLPGGNMQILLPQNWSEQWVKEVRKVNS
ncbi:MAG: hypothetical protein JXR48_11125 [Candidatus Delongbacteria bacterium]|nr:hypothetical protein [Candidatus Delongbacteria bacterium]MBN2835504.1 hypothetical protein [Candidatus Delongbacteria bacterium]